MTGGSDLKESASNVGDLGLIPGLGTHSTILAWKIPMDRGAWWAPLELQRVRHDGAQHNRQIRFKNVIQIKQNARVKQSGKYDNLCWLLFCHSVVSDSLQSHRLQHAWPPCPLPSPGAHSCPLSQSCHQTITTSVIPFSCLQSFPASGSFIMSQLFASGGQSIGASASVLPMNIQDWFPLELTGLIFSLSKRLSRDFSNITLKSINSLAFSLFYGPTLILIHDYWKNHSFGKTDLFWKSNICACLHIPLSYVFLHILLSLYW